MDGGTRFTADPVARDWIAVLLLDGFSTLSLGAITEPFALLRQRTPEAAPDLRLAGLGCRGARSASGVDVTCVMDGADLSAALSGAGAPRAVIVCGPTNSPADREGAAMPLMRKARRAGVALFGVGRIAWAMAEAGLLNGKRATVHWDTLAAFGESCRQTDACNALFVTDSRGGSCAGELATLDMIINMISACSPQSADDICNRLLVTHPRPGNLVQPGSQQDRLRHVPVLLSHAAQIMAREIENPLSASRIASDCGISVRQLERLFRKHLGMSPMRYYSSLKVERALELVSQTELPLQEIALACGFASLATLAKKFKQTFGMTPSQWRERKGSTLTIASGAPCGHHRPADPAPTSSFHDTATRDSGKMPALADPHYA